MAVKVFGSADLHVGRPSVSPRDQVSDPFGGAKVRELDVPLAGMEMMNVPDVDYEQIGGNE